MSVKAAFPHHGHDHAGCIRRALSAAEEQCRQNGSRLTDTRRRVLELVWSRHAPIGAYAVLDALKTDGQNAAPPTVYRALDFLLAQGLIHRIERLNAFVGCPHPDRPHAAQFLICRKCGAVAELDDPAIGTAIEAGAAKLGFSVSRQIVEVEGFCPDCR